MSKHKLEQHRETDLDSLFAAIGRTVPKKTVDHMDKEEIGRYEVLLKGIARIIGNKDEAK